SANSRVLRAWPARRAAWTNGPTAPSAAPTATQAPGELTGQSWRRSRPMPLTWWRLLTTQKRNPAAAAARRPDPTAAAQRDMTASDRCGFLACGALRATPCRVSFDTPPNHSLVCGAGRAPVRNPLRPQPTPPGGLTEATAAQAAATLG